MIKELIPLHSSPETLAPTLSHQSSKEGSVASGGEARESHLIEEGVPELSSNRTPN
jgi:hypothetical protein